jgi:hypothetical protein
MTFSTNLLSSTEKTPCLNLLGRLFDPLVNMIETRDYSHYLIQV